MIAYGDKCPHFIWRLEPTNVNKRPRPSPEQVAAVQAAQAQQGGDKTGHTVPGHENYKQQ